MRWLFVDLGDTGSSEYPPGTLMSAPCLCPRHIHRLTVLPVLEAYIGGECEQHGASATSRSLCPSSPLDVHSKRSVLDDTHNICTPYVRVMLDVSALPSRVSKTRLPGAAAPIASKESCTQTQRPHYLHSRSRHILILPTVHTDVLVLIAAENLVEVRGQRVPSSTLSPWLAGMRRLRMRDPLLL
ncbi:hypothetical protein BD311DRAFT_244966 [Dichomitus squalens]|uniref:Uncharacterized protein n=1 Tax=Dichomitus squalens TaxID=114155 RepID=A0A4Q9M5L7_9APHY|nr:hypothetical protein BD311DRAFT_244966 [Dichomitus squalens]